MTIDAQSLIKKKNETESTVFKVSCRLALTDQIPVRTLHGKSCSQTN